MLKLNKLSVKILAQMTKLNILNRGLDLKILTRT